MQIAFNSYSLRKEWNDLTKGDNYLPIVKFMQMMPEIKEVELLDRTFNSKEETLKKVMELFDSHGYKVFSLGPHESPLVGPKARAETIKAFKHWIDMSADNGVRNFRVSLGGGKKFDNKPRKWGLIPQGSHKPKDNAEAVEWTLEVFNPVIKYAEERDVSLCIETHHRYSSNPDYQEKLLDALPSKNLGFIFDIGNYENRELSWQSLDLLIKKKAIKYMHAKTYAFDDKGFETKLDYPKAIKLMMDAGININESIEWEGKMPTCLGIFHTYELCKYSNAKAAGKDYAMNLDFDTNEEILAKIQK